MNVGAAIVIYVIVWWCVFLALLPVGVRSRWESGEDDTPGADPGAPSDPDLRRKALRASVIALGISAVIIAIILSDVMNFRR